MLEIELHQIGVWRELGPIQRSFDLSLEDDYSEESSAEIHSKGTRERWRNKANKTN